MVDSIWIINAHTGERLEFVRWGDLQAWLAVRGLRIVGGDVVHQWISVEPD